MAAPQSGPPYRAFRPRPSVRPAEKGRPLRRPGAPGSAKKSAERRRQLSRRRRFSVMVIVPVLLMLGSVYLHTVAAGLNEKASDLREQVDRAEVEAEKLGIQVSRLSAPGRIRALAIEDLNMKDPEATELKTYGKDGEDVKQSEEERGQEDSP